MNKKIKINDAVCEIGNLNKALIHRVVGFNEDGRIIGVFGSVKYVESEEGAWKRCGRFVRLWWFPLVRVYKGEEYNV